MVTKVSIAQLQALVAIVEQGSFSAAGRQLGIAQSAISRNITELESRLRAAVFQREGRAARLTDEGGRVAELSRDALRQWRVICEEFAEPTLLHRTLRMGITEIAAQTWLPRFMTAFRAAFPWVQLQLEVSAMASELVEKVQRGQLELVMVSDAGDRSDVTVLPLGLMKCGWYCRPDFQAPRRALPIDELMRFPLVMQDHASAAGRLVLQWLESHAVQPANALYANSFAALGGMTVAGLGIGCLPCAVAHELVERGLVREIKTSPKMPPMRYVTVLRSDQGTPFLSRVAELAAEVCDYNLRYQEAG